MRTTYNTPESPDLSTLKSSIALGIALEIITFGIYAIIWKAKQLRAINHLMNTNKHHFWKWLLLSFITCGIYNVYHVYALARDIVHLQREHRITESTHLPVLSLVLYSLGIVFVADALIQHEINDIIDRTSEAPKTMPGGYRVG